MLIDSSPRYFSPRMKLLQESLAGKNLTILFRDPAEQRDKFAAALGRRFGKVGPLGAADDGGSAVVHEPGVRQIDAELAVHVSIRVPALDGPDEAASGRDRRGDPGLRGHAVRRTNAMLMDKKTPMPPEIQQAIDAYATYFLGMCHLDRNDAKQAERFFKQTLGHAARAGARPAEFQHVPLGSAGKPGATAWRTRVTTRGRGLLFAARPDDAAARQPASPEIWPRRPARRPADAAPFRATARRPADAAPSRVAAAARAELPLNPATASSAPGMPPR